MGESPDGLHYFVMEYIEGKTLYDIMAPPPQGEGKSFSEAEALDIGIQMADALAHAHQRGLIHRDVKPKNIMLTPQGVAKLTDLGLARQTDDKAAAETEAGKAYGTPYYISPEQIRGDVDIDFRADIYSLGATLYHLVTGRPPFEGETPAAVMHKHLRQPLMPADHVNTALSAGVGEIIDVAMAKRREDRYAIHRADAGRPAAGAQQPASEIRPPGRRSGIAGQDRRNRQDRRSGAQPPRRPLDVLVIAADDAARTGSPGPSIFVNIVLVILLLLLHK